MNDIKLYVIYIDIDSKKQYYKGITFFNKVEFCDELGDAFFFNHEPRKHELLKILENTHLNIGLSEVMIETIIVEIKKRRNGNTCLNLKV